MCALGDVRSYYDVRSSADRHVSWALYLYHSKVNPLLENRCRCQAQDNYETTTKMFHGRLKGQDWEIDQIMVAISKGECRNEK